MHQPGPIVLLVADDADIRRLVADLLRRENFAVEEADDGIAMDAVMTRVRPDIIVLDMMLPGQDGCRSAAACRAMASRSSCSRHAATRSTACWASRWEPTTTW